jgi:hypothetical protein
VSARARNRRRVAVGFDPDILAVARDNKFVLTACINDWGFVVPAESQGPERSPDGRWRFVYVQGVKDLLPFMIVTVVDERRAGVEREMLVVGAYNEEPEALLDAVAMCFPKHVPAAIRKAATGWARASCAAAASQEFVSAAVGIVRASGSWDESCPMLVDIGESQFEVYLEYRDQRWCADVRRSR